MEMTNLDITFLSIFVLLIFSWCISTVVFHRLSIKRIEREMAIEGIELPGWDSGIGMRFSMYAIVLIRNKADNQAFVNDKAILKFSRPIDRVFAGWMLLSLVLLLVIGAIHFILYGQHL
ncbi:hypothetical protein [Shewanella waksmanii]|uniref:hypothetical protein n=1 Tax=Shewanella waksmanii TaxID=213783 RepID=UPI0012FBC4CB|nr:hypothetical protein [Shewanella waksmanii]